MGQTRVVVDFNAPGVAEAVAEASRRALLRAGAEVESAAKRSMKAGGRSTGPRGGKVRTPSDPPNPPHVQTGNLRASITHAQLDNGNVVVGPPESLAPYGKIHEHGGEFGGRNYPARPFMTPALLSKVSAILSVFKNLHLGTTASGQRLNAKVRRS